MIKRTISSEIRTLAKEFPIVAIIGPRQSGKTTVAKMLFPGFEYVSLEDPDMRTYCLEDPRGFLKRYPSRTIFDEIQRAPDFFSYLQSHVDVSGKNGQFVITGSHNYLLMERVSQSLAGRVGIATLMPLTIKEVRQFVSAGKDLEELMFAGGYPRIYDKKIRPYSFYTSYMNTYLERDVRLLKNIVDFEAFSRFLRIIAGRSGQLLNMAAVADECSLNQLTVKEWISILETSYIVFRLRPYYKNYNKRLVKMPKLYFYDTGLLCHLLGISDAQALYTHYLRGALFETFIISEIIKNDLHTARRSNFFFWRENHGHEIDLIVEKKGILSAIEIKSGRTIKPDFFDGLSSFAKLTRIPPKHSGLIYAGDSRLTRHDIKVFPWDRAGEITE